jgi:molybdenum cofactor cytidylyltransferase
MLAAVILAAGESSRMGSPKALLPFRGHTFLEHLLDVIRDPSPNANVAPQQTKGPATQGAPPGNRRIGCTRVVLGAHEETIRAQCALDHASVVVNFDWRLGQLSSIHEALRSLPAGETDGIILFLVDHPMVTKDLVAALIRAFYDSNAPIVVPTYRGKRGHPVIFARSLYGELIAAPRSQGARSVVWAHAAEVVEVPTNEEGVVLNLNDPETLRRALNVG